MYITGTHLHVHVHVHVDSYQCCRYIQLHCIHAHMYMYLHMYITGTYLHVHVHVYMPINAVDTYMYIQLHCIHAYMYLHVYHWSRAHKIRVLLSVYALLHWYISTCTCISLLYCRIHEYNEIFNAKPSSDPSSDPSICHLVSLLLKCLLLECGLQPLSPCTPHALQPLLHSLDVGNEPLHGRDGAEEIGIRLNTAAPVEIEVWRHMRVESRQCLTQTLELPSWWDLNQ